MLRVLDWTYTGPAHRVASLFKVSLAADRAIDDVYEIVFKYFYTFSYTSTFPRTRVDLLDLLNLVRSIDKPPPLVPRSQVPGSKRGRVPGPSSKKGPYPRSRGPKRVGPRVPEKFGTTRVLL